MSGPEFHNLVPIYIPSVVVQPQTKTTTSSIDNLQPIYNKTIIQQPKTETTEPKKIEATVITNEEINEVIAQLIFDEQDYEAFAGSVLIVKGALLIAVGVALAIAFNPLFALLAVVGGAFIIGTLLSAKNEIDDAMKLENREQLQEYIKSSPERALAFKNGMTDVVFQAFEEEKKLQNLINEKNAFEKAMNGQATVLNEVMNQTAVDAEKVQQHVDEQEDVAKVKEQIDKDIKKQQPKVEILDEAIDIASDFILLQQRAQQLMARIAG